MAEQLPQKFGVELIEKLLPHRYPFLMVDRVLSWKKGETLVAEKNVTTNEPHFTGHFPGQPIMPGVLIIESIAQASALLWCVSTPEEERKKRGYLFLAGVDKMRFKRMIVPGDRMRLEVESMALRSNVFRVRGTVTVDGERAAHGELLSALGN